MFILYPNTNNQIQIQTLDEKQRYLFSCNYCLDMLQTQNQNNNKKQKTKLVFKQKKTRNLIKKT